jgi:hypothetical protein
LLGRLIRARELRLAQRDTNRRVRPFEWGASFVVEHLNGDDPRRILRQHARRVMKRSDQFYALPPIADYRLQADGRLTWTSAVQTPAPENNLARARYFPARRAQGRAVVVLPQWNADSASHVSLCRLLNRLGISALRVTLPYHEERRPPELERADYLVSSNIGRTLQSMRQAVVDARAAALWLAARGYHRLGIIGTSVGSCAAFLALAHDERFKAGVFNHVSSYFADVVWRGISTRHVRAGFGDHLTLDELRQYWLPISPFPFVRRLRDMAARPMRFIAARYDMTFPPDLSRQVIAEARRLDLPLDVVWLPCGHYTSGETPWKFLDGWKIAVFFKRKL